MGASDVQAAAADGDARERVSRAVDVYARLLKEQIAGDPDALEQFLALPDVGEDARAGDHMGAGVTLFTIWVRAQGGGR